MVAVDNLPGSVPIETTELPRNCLLLFGQESSGLTAEARAQAAMTVSIAQFGSTRSINAGVAAGIAMHAWIRQHADLARPGRPREPVRTDATWLPRTCANAVSNHRQSTDPADQATSEPMKYPPGEARRNVLRTGWTHAK